MKKPVDTEVLNDYYWAIKRKEASHPHEERMLSLVGGDPSRLTVTLHGDPYDHFYVYMLDSFPVPGYPWIRYDFMIEYHLKEPNLGIYYGCRCVAEWESDHHLAVRLATRHWNEVEEEVRRVLNATFPAKDFSQEFRETDNASDYTYWPFWLSLYPADDIREVGVRVLRLIRNVYARHLGIPLSDYKADDFGGSGKNVKTRFTDKNYRNLIRRLASIVQAEENIVSEILDEFIAGCVKSGNLREDEDLECGYRFISFMGQTRSSGCAVMAEAFMEYLNERVGKTKRSMLMIPWEAWVSVFLDSDGAPRTAEALKTKNQKRLAKGAEEYERLLGRVKKEIARIAEGK